MKNFIVSCFLFLGLNKGFTQVKTANGHLMTALRQWAG